MGGKQGFGIDTKIFIYLVMRIKLVPRIIGFEVVLLVGWRYLFSRGNWLPAIGFLGETRGDYFAEMFATGIRGGFQKAL